MRPTFAFGTIGLVWTIGYLSFSDPNGLLIAMSSIAAIPQPLWIIVGGIISFYFGINSLDKSRAWKINMKAVEAAIDRVQDLKDQRAMEEAMKNDDPIQEFPLDQPESNSSSKS